MADFCLALNLVFDGSCRVAPTDDALPGVGIGHMLGTFSHTLLFTHDQSPVEVGNKRVNDVGIGILDSRDSDSVDLMVQNDDISYGCFQK